MRVTTIVGLFVLIAQAIAQPAKAPPVEQAPFVTDAWLKDGVLSIERTITRIVPQVRTTVVKTPDGKTMNVVQTVQVPVKEKVTLTLDLKSVEIQSRDGKVVASDDVKKTLKERTTVIVSPTGRPVPEEFLKANKGPEIVVLQKPAK